MDNLQADPNHLNSLAAYQKLGAEKMGHAVEKIEDMHMKATSFVSGLTGWFSGDLWKDHGPACYEAVIAAGHAMSARKEAAEKMQTFSTNLAEDLGTATDAYRDTDEQTKDNLEGQMLR